MKALRIGLVVLGAAILLLVVAAIVFVSTFDPNNFKDDLTAWVQDRTGRTLVIGEDIELSLFPWFAVETGDVELSDDPAFGDRSFLTVDELSARVRVWPLLKREVEIGRVLLDGVNLNLGVDAEGRNNWSSLMPSSGSPDETAAAPATNASEASIRALAVEGIELRNARIRWHDANGEVAWLVQDLNLETGPVNDTAPVTVSLDLSLLDVASQFSADITLDTVVRLVGNVSLETVESTIQVLDPGEQLRAQATLTTDEIIVSGNNFHMSPTLLTARLIDAPVGPAAIDINAQFSALDFDRATETLGIEGLTTRTNGLEARWSLNATDVLSAPHVSGNTDFSATSIEALARLLDTELPEVLATSAVRQASLEGRSDFSLNLSPLTATLSNISLTALDVRASGTAELLANGEMLADIDAPAFQPGQRHLDLLAGLLNEVPEPGELTTVGARAKLRVSADSNRVSVEEFAASFDELQLGGTFNIDTLSAATDVSGQLNATGLNQRLLTVFLGDAVPAELAGAEIGAFSLDSGFTHNSSSAMTVLEPLMLTAYGLSGDGRLAIDHSGSSLALSGQASLAAFSPRALLGRFDMPVPESADPSVLRSAQIAASFETRGDDGHFRDIAIALDDSRITGEFSVENFADPSYRFVLRADRIDVDRYLPPRGNPDANAANADERTLGDIELSTEAMSNNLVTGAASVGDLTIGGMRFQQFAAELSVGRGRAALTAVRTRLYDGEFAGSFVIDTADDSPTVQLTGTASDLALRPLLVAILGESSLSGNGNFDLNLTGDGTTIGDAMRTAAGSLEFSLRDGQLDGVNLGRELCAAMNRVDRLPAPASAPESTAYRSISGSATVSDGIVFAPNLAADTGYASLTGRTNLTLADIWLDSKFVARMTGPVDIGGCAELNRHIDSSIPFGFTLAGKPPELDYGFDIAELLKAIAEKRARDRLQDRVNDRVQDAIRGLFD